MTETDYVELIKKHLHLATGIAFEEMLVVWSVTTSQNAEAIVALTDHNSRMLYEVTYDGDTERSYVDCYEKQDSIIVREH